MKYILLFIKLFFLFTCFSQDQLDSTLAADALKVDTTINFKITPLKILKRLIAKPDVNYGIIFNSKVEAGREYLLVKVDSALGKFWLHDVNSNLISIDTLYSKDNSINENQLLENFWPKSFADSMKKKYGINNWNKVLKGEVLIGWNKEQCTLSWGEPKDIHKTITSGRTSEQWVYGTSYLYFENGKLTAIQE